jgi:hypothetical protein
MDPSLIPYTLPSTYSGYSKAYLNKRWSEFTEGMGTPLAAANRQRGKTSFAADLIFDGDGEPVKVPSMIFETTDRGWNPIFMEEWQVPYARAYALDKLPIGATSQPFTMPDMTGVTDAGLNQSLPPVMKTYCARVIENGVPEYVIDVPTNLLRLYRKLKGVTVIARVVTRDAAEFLEPFVRGDIDRWNVNVPQPETYPPVYEMSEQFKQDEVSFAQHRLQQGISYFYAIEVDDPVTGKNETALLELVDSPDGKEVYWISTSYYRPHSFNNLGNFIMLSLLIYNAGKRVNLGLALYPYKQRWKPTLIMKKGFELVELPSSQT